MTTVLPKHIVLNTFSELVDQWKHPPFRRPVFNIELWYMKCFHHYLRFIPADKSPDMIPIVNRLLENAWETAFKKICRILDEHAADGVPIFNLMNERQFILRRDRTRYNRQVPGKSPKGLTRDEWEDYNHWLLSIVFWKGLVQSYDPGFTVKLPYDLKGPPEVFLQDVYKPLWGVWAAFKEANIPYMGMEGDCINVRPYASWELHLKRITTGIPQNNKL